MVREIRPDYIINLVGTFRSEDAESIYRSNVLSVTSILEAARKYSPRAKIITSGSAAEYGRVDSSRMPITEETPSLPVMLYGLSKQMATQAALYYARVHSMCVMVVRPFQIIGNGVSDRTAPGAFAKQLKMLLAEGKKVIQTGNLESSRDFIDVHDVVKAIWMLCEKPMPGEIFNLCSGSPVCIRDLLEMMIKESGAQLKVEIDPVRLRGKADVSQIYGSYQKLHRHCGWCPTISLRESVKMMLDKDA